MNFNDIKTFIMVLLALCGAISVIGGAIKLIREWKKESKITVHDTILKDHEQRLKKVEDATKEQDGFTKVLCNSVLALVSHEINGNSKDKLESAQKELQDFLIQK